MKTIIAGLKLLFVLEELPSLLNERYKLVLHPYTKIQYIGKIIQVPFLECELDEIIEKAKVHLTSIKQDTELSSPFFKGKTLIK